MRPVDRSGIPKPHLGSYGDSWGGLPFAIRTRSLARNREQIRRLLEPGFKPRVGLVLGGNP